MMEINEPSPSIIHNQVLWYNRYITIQNQCFFWKKWKEAGILKVHDLMTDNNFLSANELSYKYNIHINFLEVLQIRQSLPYAWRTLLNSHEPIKTFEEIMYYDSKEIKLLNKTDAKQIYYYFNSINKPTPTCLHKWQITYPTIPDTAWGTIFKLSFITTRETSLQSFQYKILHRTITCRKKLYEMRLVDSPICTVCTDSTEVDNLQHFFCNCSYVNTFWVDLFTWLNRKFNYSLTINEKDILFGIEGSNDIIGAVNYIILHAKLFIYRNRINDIHTLSMPSFKAQLKHKLVIERIITRQYNPEKFIKFQSLFDEL